jgi:hypothetical protein
VDKPEVKQVIGGYEFNWVDDHITIKVSRIQVQPDGSVIGEIFISNSDKALYPQSRLNFSAPRTNGTGN